MIKSFINTILLYVALMFLMSLVFCLGVQADDNVIIGVAPGEDEKIVIEVTSEYDVPDLDPEPATKRPESEKLNKYMNKDLQQYIWGLCEARGLTGAELKTYYGCMIGLAEGESTFKATKTNKHNKNGSCDRGLYQINEINVPMLKKKGYISCTDDLYDPYMCAKCGEYIFWQGYKETGYSEQCYTRYLYGDKKYRSNDYTQRVWKMMQQWVEELR